MTPAALHQHTVRWAARKLGARLGDDADLRLKDGSTALVRAANPYWNTVHVAPRYTYRYRWWTWNLHRHGEPIRPFPGYWVLIGRDGRKRRMWVVPGRRLRGKTAQRLVDRKRSVGWSVLERYEVV